MTDNYRDPDRHPINSFWPYGTMGWGQALLMILSFIAILAFTVTSLVSLQHQPLPNSLVNQLRFWTVLGGVSIYSQLLLIHTYDSNKLKTMLTFPLTAEQIGRRSPKFTIITEAFLALILALNLTVVTCRNGCQNLSAFLLSAIYFCYCFAASKLLLRLSYYLTLRYRKFLFPWGFVLNLVWTLGLTLTLLSVYLGFRSQHGEWFFAAANLPFAISFSHIVTLCPLLVFFLIVSMRYLSPLINNGACKFFVREEMLELGYPLNLASHRKARQSLFEKCRTNKRLRHWAFLVHEGLGFKHTADWLRAAVFSLAALMGMMLYADMKFIGDTLIPTICLVVFCIAGSIKHANMINRKGCKAFGAPVRLTEIATCKLIIYPLVFLMSGLIMLIVNRLLYSATLVGTYHAATNMAQACLLGIAICATMHIPNKSNESLVENPTAKHWYVSMLQLATIGLFVSYFAGFIVMAIAKRESGFILAESAKLLTLPYVNKVIIPEIINVPSVSHLKDDPLTLNVVTTSCIMPLTPFLVISWSCCVGVTVLSLIAFYRYAANTTHPVYRHFSAIQRKTGQSFKLSLDTQNQSP